MLPEQQVEQRRNQRQQRCRLDVCLRHGQADGVLAASGRLNVDQEGRDHSICDAGHGRAHHAQQLIQRFVSEDISTRPRVRREHRETFHEYAGAGLGIWEPGGPSEPSHLIDRQSRPLPDILHCQERTAADREDGGQTGQHVAIRDEIGSGCAQVDQVAQQLQPQTSMLVSRVVHPQ
jgi:hypothetical protein